MKPVSAVAHLDPIHPEKSTIVRTEDRNWAQVAIPGWIRSTLRFGARALPTRAATGLVTRAFLDTQRGPLSKDARRFLRSGQPLAVQARGEHVQAWSFGEGPTILLVHGHNGRGSQLRHIAKRFVEEGFRVVLFDAIGHGDSGGRTASIVSFADSILSVARAVGPVYGIVAHSLGAQGTTMAMNAGLTAERLIYIGAPVDPGEWVEAFSEALELLPEVKAGFVQNLENLIAGRWDTWHGGSLLSRIRARVLVMHDRDDRETPYSGARRLADLAPQSELYTTEGLGHRGALRDESTINEMVRFMTHQGR